MLPGLSVEVNAEHDKAAQDHDSLTSTMFSLSSGSFIHLFLAQGIGGVTDGAPWPWHQPQWVGLANGGDQFQAQSPSLPPSPSPVVGRDGMSQAHNAPRAHAALSLAHTSPHAGLLLAPNSGNNVPEGIITQHGHRGCSDPCILHKERGGHILNCFQASLQPGMRSRELPAPQPQGLSRVPAIPCEQWVQPNPAQPHKQPVSHQPCPRPAGFLLRDSAAALPITASHGNTPGLSWTRGAAGTSDAPASGGKQRGNGWKGIPGSKGLPWEWGSWGADSLLTDPGMSPIPVENPQQAPGLLGWCQRWGLHRDPLQGASHRDIPAQAGPRSLSHPGGGGGTRFAEMRPQRTPWVWGRQRMDARL